MNYLLPLQFVPSLPLTGEGYVSRKQKVTNISMVYRSALAEQSLGVRTEVVRAQKRS